MPGLLDSEASRPRPVFHIRQCLCSALLYGNNSVFKLGWSAIGISLLVATIAAALSLPATMLLDQLFWYRQKLGKKRRHGKFEHSREMQLMTAAALSTAFDTVGCHRAFFDWHSAIELLRVEAMQVLPAPSHPCATQNIEIRKRRLPTLTSASHPDARRHASRRPLNGSVSDELRAAAAVRRVRQ